MSIILDIALVAFLIFAYIHGRNKGLVKSVWKITALIVTIVAVLLLKTPAVEFVSGTKASDNIYNSISKSIQLPPGGGVNITENLHLPVLMKSQINTGIEGAQSAASIVQETAAVSLTRIVILIAVCIALFIAIRLSLMGVYYILCGLTKAPIIRGANRFAGGLLGIVNMVFIVFLALALFTIFAPADSFFYEAIQKTYVVKYFYDYNLLLQLFVR